MSTISNSQTRMHDKVHSLIIGLKTKIWYYPSNIQVQGCVVWLPPLHTGPCATLFHVISKTIAFFHPHLFVTFSLSVDAHLVTSSLQTCSELTCSEGSICNSLIWLNCFSVSYDKSFTWIVLCHHLCWVFSWGWNSACLYGSPWLTHISPCVCVSTRVNNSESLLSCISLRPNKTKNSAMFSQIWQSMHTVKLV